MHIVNRTPHAVTIISPRGRYDLPAASREDIARVDSSNAHLYHIHPETGFCSWKVPGDGAGIPISATSWGEITGLPAPQSETVHVVSAVVVAAAHVAGRNIADLLVPGGQVRDSAGKIIGCASLTRGQDSLPGGLLQRPAPLVVIFGSAARAAQAGKAATAHVHDIDVVYAHCDPFEAQRIACEWAQRVGLRARLPLDLHPELFTPGDLSASKDRVTVPHPAETEPPPVIFAAGAVEVSYQEIRSLPAAIRRAAAEIEAGCDSRGALRRIIEAMPGDIAMTTDRPDPTAQGYFGGGILALRRAWMLLGYLVGYLGDYWSDELDALEPGTGSFLTQLCRGVHPDCIGPLQRGCPNAARSGAPFGMLCVSRRGDGKLTAGPGYNSKGNPELSEATLWLKTGRSSRIEPKPMAFF